MLPKPFFSKPKVSQRRAGKKRLLIAFFLVGMFSFIFGYKLVQNSLVKVDTILVLGGHEERELFAASFAKKHPDFSVWVSSGSPKPYVEKIFAKEGIDRDRLHLDYTATDTVTNFTTLVKEFKRRGVYGVYLVTSANHMPRANLVGQIVFGSQGIVIKPKPVGSNYPHEPLEKSVRDGVRAIFWVFTHKAV